MGHAEFVDWMAYYQIEPFGGARGDIQAALVASLIANANRDAKKRPEAFRPGDFVPDWWGSRQAAKEPESLIAKFKMLTEKLDG